MLDGDFESSPGRSYVFQKRSATGAVDHDCVEAVRVERVKVRAGQAPRGFKFAVVAVKRAATLLGFRRLHLASIGRQRVDGVSIDGSESHVLHAARGKAEAKARRAPGGKCARGGERLVDQRDHGFGLDRVLAKKPEETAFTKRSL